MIQEYDILCKSSHHNALMGMEGDTAASRQLRGFLRGDVMDLIGQTSDILASSSLSPHLLHQITRPALLCF